MARLPDGGETDPSRLQGSRISSLRSLRGRAPRSGRRKRRCPGSHPRFELDKEIDITAIRRVNALDPGGWMRYRRQEIVELRIGGRDRWADTDGADRKNREPESTEAVSSGEREWSREAGEVPAVGCGPEQRYPRPSRSSASLIRSTIAVVMTASARSPRSFEAVRRRSSGHVHSSAS